MIDLSEIAELQVIHKCNGAKFSVGFDKKEISEEEFLSDFKMVMSKMKDCPNCKRELELRSGEKLKEELSFLNSKDV